MAIGLEARVKPFRSLGAALVGILLAMSDFVDVIVVIVQKVKETHTKVVIVVELICFDDRVDVAASSKVIIKLF